MNSRRLIIPVVGACFAFACTFSAFLLLGLIQGLPVHALNIVVLQPRVPADGRFVQHDIWDEVEAIWTCRIIRSGDTIFDACNYEDVFPRPEPPPWKRRLADKDGRWVCIPNTTELSPIQEPFVKGLCLFAGPGQVFPNSFEPTPEQLAEADKDRERLMRVLLTLDPAAAAQNPEQAYLLKTQKDAARQQIFYVATANNAINAYKYADPVVEKLMGIVRKDVSTRLDAEIDNLAYRVNDPADPNFREIVVPAPPPYEPVSAEAAFGQANADAINALAQDLNEMIGVHRAALVSLDRATGAREAGEPAWEQRQLQAALRYDTRYARYIERLPQRMAALADVLASASISTTVTSADVVLYQQAVISNTLAPTKTQELAALGLSPADIDEVRIRTVAHSPDATSKLAGGKFPDLLRAPEIARAAQEFAAALRAGPVGAPRDLYLPFVFR